MAKHNLENSSLSKTGIFVSHKYLTLSRQKRMQRLGCMHSQGRCSASFYLVRIAIWIHSHCNLDFCCKTHLWSHDFNGSTCQSVTCHHYTYITSSFEMKNLTKFVNRAREHGQLSKILIFLEKIVIYTAATDLLK